MPINHQEEHMLSKHIKVDGIYAVQSWGDYQPGTDYDHSNKLRVVEAPKKGMVRVISADEPESDAPFWVATRAVKATWADHERLAAGRRAARTVIHAENKAKRQAGVDDLLNATVALEKAGVAEVLTDISRYGAQRSEADEIAQELADLHFIVEVPDHGESEGFIDRWFESGKHAYQVRSPGGIAATYHRVPAIALTAEQVVAIFEAGLEHGLDHADRV
jgi:hypothetical protein